MHYEVELREFTYEADGTGGLRVTGSMWKPVRVFDADSDNVGRAFRDDVGHRFRSKSAGRSD
jgi:hypothetical protein